MIHLEKLSDFIKTGYNSNKVLMTHFRIYSIHLAFSRKNYMRIIILLIFGFTGVSFAGGSHDHSHSDKSRSLTTDFGEYKKNMEFDRNIKIIMDDEMRFYPSAIRIKRGEIIEFTIVNEGQIVHEFVLGTREYLANHAKEMLENPLMAHDAANIAHVKPGKSKQVV